MLIAIHGVPIILWRVVEINIFEDGIFYWSEFVNYVFEGTLAVKVHL